MKRPQALVLGGLVALVLLLGGVFLIAAQQAAADHGRFTAELREGRRLDAAINLEVLATRFNQSRSYDDLARDVGRIRQLAARLEVPAHLSADPDHRLSDRIRDYREAVEAKAVLVERFKSRNAVFRNSMDYFPAGISALARLARQHSGASQTAGVLDELLRSMLLFIQTTETEYAKEIAQQVGQLESARAGLPTEQDQQRLGNLLLHGRSLLQLKPELDQLLKDILNAPTDREAEELFNAYSSAYARQEAVADRYQIILSIIALLMVGYIFMMGMRLRRTSRQLRITNLELARNFEELQAAEQAQRLYGEIFQNSAEGIMISAADTTIMEVNPAFSVITGFSPDEVKGRKPEILQSGAHPKSFYQRMWGALNDTGAWAGEIWNRRKNGKIYPQWLSITTLRDVMGQVTHYIGVFSDITERKETEERLQYLAEHDVLTGLPNRTLAQDRLQHSIAQANRDRKHLVAVMFVDLDRFKVINDTLGHDYGDEVLRVVAGRLRGLVRETDTISRQGGDEFLVILPQIPHADDAGQVAHKIITTLAEPFELNGSEMSITSSVGIAIYPDDGDSMPVLLRNADTAMYRAKSMGRNTFCYYRADMNASSMEILRMESLLRHVVARQELVLHYQPQVELASGVIRGVEALLRWNSPEMGLVPPVRFIPLAEETGLITPIGEWVLREACRWARQMHDAGHAGLRLAVNLSARQFADQGLVDVVADALASSGLPAEFLELELTESALMHNLEAGQLTLARLKALGIELAVDDFGTGYSSLAYLQRFPIDRLKIDRSFITGVARKPEDETIARAIIVLAHALGLEVVAEGVEDEEQCQVLKDLGCDLIQGYYVSRPVPGEQISALIGR